MDAFEKVKEIIVEVLSVNEKNVTREASFDDDFGADSIEIFELVLTIEQEFGFEISYEEGEKILTVGDLVKCIESHK